MYFIDVQGTLIDDIEKQPIKGALEFIDALNAKGIPYMVITNNTKRSSEDFLEYLHSIGLNIADGHYLDPLMVLDAMVDKKGVAAFGSKEFLTLLQARGYELDYKNIDTVLVAIKEDFSAQEYALMIDAIIAGAKLIGMHETTIYAKNAKRYPGVGAILQMLSFATSASYSVVGKPSKRFYAKALEMIQAQKGDVTFKDITIISDDVKGDLIGAKALGMRTQFVLSGKYRSAEEIIPKLKCEDRPDGIYATIGEYYEDIR